MTGLVEQRIAAALDGVTTLDLSGLRLRDLPQSIASMTHLTELNLSINEFELLPPAVRSLTRLTTLDLDINRLAELPPWLAELTGLTKISVEENRLRRVPESIRSLLNLSELDACGNQLVEVPEWFGELSALTELRLDFNRLRTLPDSMSRLTGLKRLDIDHNQLTEVPPWLADLNDLSVLYLGQNQFVEIPSGLGTLKALTTLWLHGCGLAELPDWITELTKLQSLHLESNRLRQLPDSISGLTALTSLWLNGNELTGLPDTIGQLELLESLMLSANQLSEIPECIHELHRLTTLNIGSNQITSLPSWLAEHKGLSELAIGGNPIELIPDWISELTELSDLSINDLATAELPAGIGTLSKLTTLRLGHAELRCLPDWLGQLPKLERIRVYGSKVVALPETMRSLHELSDLVVRSSELTELPDWIGELTSLISLDLDGNRISRLPDTMRSLTRLTQLSLDANQLRELPEWLGDLAALEELRVSYNNLVTLPTTLGDLSRLVRLDLAGCQLSALPESLRNLTELTNLDLSANQLVQVPEWIGELANLTALRLAANPLPTLPDSIGRLHRLNELDISQLQLTEVPTAVSGLTDLQTLRLSDNALTGLPEELAQLQRLEVLEAGRNRLTSLPFGLGELALKTLDVAGNPLPREFQAANGHSTEELLRLLRLLEAEGLVTREAKLVLVGEGAVGKSSLLAALRDEVFVDGRSTTHGIEVKRLTLGKHDESITFNAWDFGGQTIYRPTHQLFFSAPAVYLVVWKPREGSEQGFVDYWIKLIQHRAEEGAKVIVVATHGGPLQRQAYLDEVALRDRYEDLILDFVHVDSRTGFNIDRLRQAIVVGAAGLPHLNRWQPASWLGLREEISRRDEPYLPYERFEALALEQGLSETSARSLAMISQVLGHWIYYAEDPQLCDLVIFKPDWLAIAISLVLDDEATIGANGLLQHSSLLTVWDNPARPSSHRYPARVHRIFLRLMQKFDISYPVADGSDRERPTSLVAQLVRADRPDLSPWDGYGSDLDERSYVCEIFEVATAQPATPEGLMYQLIVRFHRYSLGRDDYHASRHWQHGLVLDAGLSGRALITMERNRLKLIVRAAYPQFLLHQLTADIRDQVHSFWPGLRTQVLVSCETTCSNEQRVGLFDLDMLIAARRDGRPQFPCNACADWKDIDALLLGADERVGSPTERMAQAVREAVSQDFAQVMDVIEIRSKQVLDRIEALDVNTLRAILQVEEQLRDLVLAFDDDAREGPRLFTLTPVETTITRPGWTKQRVRLALYCEHSRLPLSMLNGEAGPTGVYDIDVPRDWLVKAAPWINALSMVVRILLPISLAAIKLDASDAQWQAHSERLELAEKSLAALTGVSDLTQDLQSHNVDGGLIRTVHALLKERDPSFAGLVRIMDRNRYLWIHRRFVELRAGGSV